ncbi:uncharacterized protein AB675_2116 [Cyphellophora attinorum]|uniref:Uncharacterized protein n=1 Tax=Cyphellophora attinorum TaxID=1664694 RepID=A0A0N1HXW4_9EURO|nr:uncharacterized protein AB675_2116 [Phialophora attinorum]KPI42974.1 hypothetical protein AB675_2116 [Phialophora attinorum]
MPKSMKPSLKIYIVNLKVVSKEEFLKARSRRLAEEAKAICRVAQSTRSNSTGARRSKRKHSSAKKHS